MPPSCRPSTTPPHQSQGVELQLMTGSGKSLSVVLGSGWGRGGEQVPPPHESDPTVQMQLGGLRWGSICPPSTPMAEKQGWWGSRAGASSSTAWLSHTVTGENPFHKSLALTVQTPARRVQVWGGSSVPPPHLPLC